MRVLRLRQFYFRIKLAAELCRNHLVIDRCQRLEVVPVRLNHAKHFFQQSLQVGNLPFLPLKLRKLIYFYLLTLVKLRVYIFHYNVGLLQHLLEMAALLTQNVDLVLVLLNLRSLRPDDN